jgi:hypothetical protein
MLRPLAAFVALAVSLPLAGQSASADPLEPLRADLVKGLETLAGWSQDAKMFRERDRCWRTILAVSPDHAAARKALQYTRQKDGTWKQAPGYREPATTDKSKASDFEARWKAVTDPSVEKGLGAVAALAGAANSRAREALLASLVQLGPDDARVREARGEARLGNRWVLKETAAAAQRRKEIAALAAKCAASAKVADLVVDDSNRIKGLDWKFSAKSGRIMALSTTSKEDVAAIAKEGHAALELIDALFEGPDYRGATVTVYFVEGVDQAQAVLTERPTPKEMSWVFVTGSGGCWLHDSDVLAVAHSDTRNRVDTAVRALMDAAMRVRYRLAEMDVVSQGLTTVLSGILSGVRTIQSRSGDAELALLDSLRAKGADWEKAARDLLKAGKWPKIADAFATEVPQARPSAELYGHIVTLYLLLGSPDRCQQFFTTLGAGKPGPAIESALGLDLETFDRRLQRWIVEMGELPASDSRKAPK